MWEYNNTDSLYHGGDELIHYGVPGMKWGKRKAAKIQNRKDRSTARVNRIALKKPNSKKLNKAQIKDTKIQKSRYGRTTGNIIAKGALKHIGIAAIGSTLYGAAMKAGRPAAAKSIATIGTVALTGNMIKTGYQATVNYKPRNK